MTKPCASFTPLIMRKLMLFSSVSSVVRTAFRAAFVLSFFLMTACSPDGEKPDDGVSVTSLPCAIDAECAELGFVCDDGRRTCVCTSDAMCDDKEGTPYCNAFTGHCVAGIAGCKNDDECGQNEFCDGALRICREKKSYCGSCTQDAECGGPNDYCVKHPDFPGSASYCGTACTAEGACEAGQACRDTEKGKQCVPANSRCQSGQSQSCAPDSGQSCQVDDECTEGGRQQCDTTTNKCRAVDSGCRSNQSCDPDTRKCVTSCQFDTECQERYGDNFVCEDDACVPTTSCKKDKDCGDDAYCFKTPGSTAEDVGSCQASCRGNADCHLQQRCSETSPRKCEAGCSENSDCPLSAICTAGGACEFKDSGGAQRCQVREVCGFKEYCIDNACRAEPKHCGPPQPSCPSGGLLSPITFSPGCRAGVAIACPGGTPAGVIDMGACFANMCKIERCLYACPTGGDCPNGFYCASFLGNICFPNDNNAIQCL